MKKLQSMKSFLAILLSLCLVLGSMSPMSAYAAEEEAGSEAEKTECELNGHDYEIVDWIWSADNSTCNVKLVCKTDPAHTAVKPAAVTSKRIAATCEKDGQETLTASYELNGEKQERTYTHTLNALGHNYKFDRWNWAADYSEASAKLICSRDKNHEKVEKATITSEEVEPTCLKDGSITYTASVKLNEESEPITDKKTVVGKKALGHNYQAENWIWEPDCTGATTEVYCVNDPKDRETVKAEVVCVDDSTCTEDGKKVYTATAYAKGKSFTETVTVRVIAKGHLYGDPEYTWDGTESAEATFTCDVCDYQEVVPCEISEEVIPESTTEHGRTEYTASCEYAGKTYQNVKVIVDADHESHLVEERVYNEEDGSYDDVVRCEICETVMSTDHVDYTLVYDGNGGNGSMEDQVVEYGKPFTTAENEYTNKGYYFAGWYAQRISDGGVYAVLEDGTADWFAEEDLKEMHQDGYTFDAGEELLDLTDVNNDTIVFYACWKKVVYTVSFDANGGKGSMEDMTVTYGEAQSLTDNAFTCTGYRFNGWYAHRVSDDKYYAKKTDDKKGWYTEEVIEANGYTKAFYSNQGTISTATAVHEDEIEMIAQWKVNTYKVIYDANGGTGSMSSSSMEYGVKTPLNANKFKMTGHHFGGWNVYRESDHKYYAKNADGKKGWYTKEALEKNGYALVVFKDKAEISTLTKVHKDTLTMIAIWKANTYTLSFDANGGSNTMKDLKVTYGKTVKLTANKFTRKGYTFKGWNAYRSTDKKWYAKNKDGKKSWYTSATIKEEGYTKVVFKDQASVSKFNSQDKVTIKMKAVWKK